MMIFFRLADWKLFSLIFLRKKEVKKKKSKKGRFILAINYLKRWKVKQKENYTQEDNMLCGLVWLRYEIGRKK